LVDVVGIFLFFCFCFFFYVYQINIYQTTNQKIVAQHLDTLNALNARVDSLLNKQSETKPEEKKQTQIAAAPKQEEKKQTQSTEAKQEEKKQATTVKSGDGGISC
jgi:flagellar motor protein MotB